MNSFERLLANFNALAPDVIALFNAFCYLMGGIFGIWCLFMVANNWQFGRQDSLVGQRMAPLIPFALASAFMFMPSLLGSLSMTMFDGVGASNVLAAGGTPPSNRMAEPIIRFVEIVGLIAVARGLIKINSVGKTQDATVGSVITHLAGGCAALNISIIGPLLGDFVGLDVSWFFG